MEKNVKIKKVLNNNVVIAQNDNEETILMGLGLGFGKKAGEVVEDKKIEKIFRSDFEVQSSAYALVNMPLPFPLAV